jgi:hypothetical protein
VFDDLAHQIVHQTTLSLHSAASQIKSRASPTDAQLFLIKHLLTLKQQIVAFDIEFVTPDVDVSFDFSNVTATFWELRSRGGLFNPANLVRLVGGGLIPRVVRDMLDAKSELDGRLRTVINEFVEGFSSRMLQPVGEKEVAKKSFDANQATLAVRDLVEKDTKFLRSKLDGYISDARTRETLVAAVMDKVVDGYEDFFERWSVTSGNGATAGNGTGKGKKKGKASVDQVWDPDVFSEWAGGVFCVGRIGFVGDDDGDDSIGGGGSERSL